MDQLVELEAKVKLLEDNLVTIQAENQGLKLRLQDAIFQGEMLRLFQPYSPKHNKCRREHVLDDQFDPDETPKTKPESPCKEGELRFELLSGSFTADKKLETLFSESEWASVTSYLRRRHGVFIEAVLKVLKDMAYREGYDAVAVEQGLNGMNEDIVNRAGMAVY